MNASDYNKYLAAIKAANDCDPDWARTLLRQIQSDMVSHYGRSDSDVDYLLRQFRYHV